MAVGEIVLALHSTQFKFTPAFKKEMTQVLSKIDSTSLDSFGSEVIRLGACHYLHCVAQTDCLDSLDPKELENLQDSWWNMINQTLSRPEEVLLPVASKALESFLLNPLVVMSKTMMDFYLSSIQITKEKYAKRGFSMALGKVPFDTLCLFVDEMVTGLIDATTLHENSLYNDAESRRNTVHSIIEILRKLASVMVLGTHARVKLM
jgi:hypothetical protein